MVPDGLIGPGEDFFTDVTTPNDADDTDSGANNLQNKPVISSATTGSTKITIKGRLESNHNQTFTVEFYSNPSDGHQRGQESHRGDDLHHECGRAAHLHPTREGAGRADGNGHDHQHLHARHP